MCGYPPKPQVRLSGRGPRGSSVCPGPQEPPPEVPPAGLRVPGGCGRCRLRLGVSRVCRPPCSAVSGATLTIRSGKDPLPRRPNLPQPGLCPPRPSSPSPALLRLLPWGGPHPSRRPRGTGGRTGWAGFPGVGTAAARLSRDMQCPPVTWVLMQKMPSSAGRPPGVHCATE